MHGFRSKHYEGINYEKQSTTEKRTKKELNSTFNTNVVGTINICKNYLNFHKKLKLEKCSIINIGSIYGILSPDFNIYGKGDNIIPAFVAP